MKMLIFSFYLSNGPGLDSILFYSVVYTNSGLNTSLAHNFWQGYFKRTVIYRSSFIDKFWYFIAW